MNKTVIIFSIFLVCTLIAEKSAAISADALADKVLLEVKLAQGSNNSEKKRIHAMKIEDYYRVGGKLKPTIAKILGSIYFDLYAYSDEQNENDVRNAIGWFSVAAQGGEMDAAVLLGNIYLDGTVVSDREKAFLFFCIARETLGVEVDQHVYAEFGYNLSC